MAGKRSPAAVQREKMEDVALLAVDVVGVSTISVLTIILYLKAFSPNNYTLLVNKLFFTLNKLEKLAVQMSTW
ncbi:hypothetical protein G7K71_04945 [Desulfofundulus sp. TPOSR]|jgi:hypothetical protein|uniref:Uncharacterized protein n=1 Tax=Desulfofundulus kuznetsovii (strain DSM 6115 / VKM B-1805 / 17) TaxID=760568 RepID=A0AAU8PTN6_DESK7|nr:hypothetical protein [Desulfofundulus sp. TPOSR]AEG14004.1 hypothetical protein Desku_0376 [Desulfofundulus kuznetsovii DSM 6115]NHM26348.1 hypothetical protein [Desulfofundulus sp. TPOSR]